MLDQPTFVESSFLEGELDDTMRCLFEEGRYAEGEDLCKDILASVRPECDTARLYLLLNLAAQDLEPEALDLLDELSNRILFEAQKLLALGQETNAEVSVCEKIEICLAMPERPGAKSNRRIPKPSLGDSKALRRVLRRVARYRHPAVPKS